MGGGLIAGLFLAGLAGSPLHCGPMCGGFVLAQVADRMAATPAGRLCERQRISAGALLPYHVGRILTYAVLGGLAGLGGAFLGGPMLDQGVPAVLLMLAAGLFASMAWRRWRRPGVGRVARGNAVVVRRRAPVQAGPAGWATIWSDVIRRAGQRSGLRLGLALGFLPCGFLYAALLTAAASRDPLTAAVGMAAFGVGTMPALVAIGIAGHAAGQRWRAAIASVAPFILVANAALLTLLAIRGLLA